MNKLFNKIKSCRICNDKKLYKLIDFGNLSLTGIFPSKKNTKVAKTPLSIVFSNKSKLLQLQHNYNSDYLFGSNYGYRSGLNKSMVIHLKKKYDYLNRILYFKKDDSILDIGSNDGTFLNFFPKNTNRVGCDPSAKKFKKYYNKNTKKIYKIFDENVVKTINHKFKLITAIAMFYDLSDPISFCKNVEKLLDDDGIFHVEIAYLPDIVKEFSFDTFCQEHLTYFSFISFKNLIDKTKFRIIDYHRNSINGGSINFDLVLNESNIKSKSKKIENLYKYELKNNFNKLSKYKIFFKKIKKNINEIEKKINILSKKKNKIYGFGASTKGNVTLQLCNLDDKKISAIYDVNKEKFGSYTPGTNILIKDERKLLEDKPDYLILLIWHFKKTIKQKFNSLKMSKINIISLFPNLRIIKKK